MVSKEADLIISNFKIASAPSGLDNTEYNRWIRVPR